VRRNDRSRRREGAESDGVRNDGDRMWVGHRQDDTEVIARPTPANPRPISTGD
jgi:hypothetical protein